MTNIHPLRLCGVGALYHKTIEERSEILNLRLEPVENAIRMDFERGIREEDLDRNGIKRGR